MGGGGALFRWAKAPERRRLERDDGFTIRLEITAGKVSRLEVAPATEPGPVGLREAKWRPKDMWLIGNSG